MSKYENLSGRNDPQRPIAPGRKVYGQFECQYCPEIVDQASFLPSQHVLTWVCSSEHVSLVEDFDLN